MAPLQTWRSQAAPKRAMHPCERSRRAFCCLLSVLPPLLHNAKGPDPLRSFCAALPRTRTCCCSGSNFGPLTLRRSGTSLSVTGRGSEARVVIANLPAGSGLVHVVSSVLLPFYTDVLQASGAPQYTPPDVHVVFSQPVPADGIRNVEHSADCHDAVSTSPACSLVRTRGSRLTAQALERNPNLSQVASALSTTGLAGAFDNPNITFTVFAPTSKSFACIPVL